MWPVCSVTYVAGSTVVVLRRGLGHPAIIRKRFRAAVPRPQTAWIPAFARMTFTGSAESRYWRCANPTPRHSREGGNPDGVVVLRRGFGHPAIIRKRFRAAVPRPQTAWIPAFARMTFTGSEELGFWLRAGLTPSLGSPLRPCGPHPVIPAQVGIHLDLGVAVFLTAPA